MAGRRRPKAAGPGRGSRGPLRAGRVAGAGGGGRKRAAARAGWRGPVTSLGFQGSLPEAPGPLLPALLCPPPVPRLRAAAGISRSQLAGGRAPPSQPPSPPSLTLPLPSPASALSLPVPSLPLSSASAIPI